MADRLVFGSDNFTVLLWNLSSTSTTKLAWQFND